MPGLDAPGHRGRDRTASWLRRRLGPIRSRHVAGQVASASLNCSSPIELPSGVDEAGGRREADVGDAVDGFQPRCVVFLDVDVDAARAQFVHFGGKVAHVPRGLGLVFAGAGRAVGDDEAAVPSASEGQESSVTIKTRSPILSP